MTLTLRRHFSCAHFYHQPLWDEKKNRETFGKCFTEYGHGHDYQLEVTFSSSAFHLDESSLSSFKQTLARILDPLIEKIDHQHLNFMIPEFMTPKNSTAASKIPTTENLALCLREQILAALTNNSQSTKAEITLQQLRLFERPDLWVEL